jgi:hypothetical protein
LTTLAGRPGVEDAYLFGVTLRAVATAGAVDDVRAALAPLGRVTAAEPTLEDAFVTLVREHRGGGPA